MVIGSIIQYQDQALVGVNGEGEMFEKGDEGSTVLPVRGQPVNIAAAPVVSTKDMAEFGCTGRRDSLALPPLHPTAAQNGMQTQARFVQEEGLEGRDGTVSGVFFNQSSTCPAISCA